MEPVNRKNRMFRYVDEERMITDRERRHIDEILQHPLETDRHLLELYEMVNDEAPPADREDHGLLA